MAHKNRFVLRIEGSEQKGHQLDLAVFAKKTRQFLNLLRNSAKESGRDGAIFHVVGLSHGSPATIECEPAGQTYEDATVLFESTRKWLKCAEEGQAHKLSHAVLSSMEQLAHYDPEEAAWVRIQTLADGAEDKTYTFDDRFRKILIESRKAEAKSIGTISGRLEQINIHKNANTFKIYPSIPVRPPVTCKFQASLLEDVRGALKKFVSVRGRCFYRPEGAFPYKIDVWTMTVFPPLEELPSLSDLRGIAPGATGEKSSEQFVRELRGQWTKDV